MTVTRSPYASCRTAQLSMSAIKDMAIRAAKLPDVASLTWGLPSFRTPEHIREAVAEALREDPDVGKYTLPDGLPQLREAVADTHFALTGLRVSAGRNVVVTAGNMEGVKVVLDTILDDGDEVILTDPGFASHVQQIMACGGQPIYWPLDEARGWAADIGKLEPLISPRTRAILLVTPSNPTGTILDREVLLSVGEIALRHGILVVLDDPYSHFAFHQASDCFNLASAEAYADNVAYLFSFSKCHAMSGWRLGYAVVPEALKRQMLKLHDATLICAPRPSQLAGLAALRGSGDHLDEFRSILDRRRNLICGRLDRVRHVFSYIRPRGAYYVFPRIETAHENATQFCLDLLNKAQVCVTPGSAFGPSGEGHVRMAFCVSDEEIEKAFDRIEQHFPS